MGSPVQQSARNISNLLAIDEEYRSPAVVAQNCRQKNWAEEHRRSIENPEAFGGDYARKFWWSRSWDKVLDWDGVHHQWFAGAKTNVTINALDRHASSERRNRAWHTSGWARTGANALSPTGNCTGWSAASRMG